MLVHRRAAAAAARTRRAKLHRVQKEVPTAIDTTDQSRREQADLLLLHLPFTLLHFSATVHYPVLLLLPPWPLCSSPSPPSSPTLIHLRTSRPNPSQPNPIKTTPNPTKPNQTQSQFHFNPPQKSQPLPRWRILRSPALPWVHCNPGVPSSSPQGTP